MTIETYYHAGTEISGQTTWATSSHTNREAAENQARAMAEAMGGRPVVEWWDGQHGPEPNDAECVQGAEYMD